MIVPDATKVHSMMAERQLEKKIDFSKVNVQRGQAITARQCGICHTFGPGEPDKIGPSLYGIENRNIASLSNFSYSDSLKMHQKEKWTADTLNSWLHHPLEFSPATLMAYAGLSSDQDRADVIAYLKTLSPPPVSAPDRKEKANSSDSGHSIPQNVIKNGKNTF